MAILIFGLLELVGIECHRDIISAISRHRCERVFAIHNN